MEIACWQFHVFFSFSILLQFTINSYKMLFYNCYHSFFMFYFVNAPSINNFFCFYIKFLINPRANNVAFNVGCLTNIYGIWRDCGSLSFLMLLELVFGVTKEEKDFDWEDNGKVNGEASDVDVQRFNVSQLAISLR